MAFETEDRYAARDSSLASPRPPSPSRPPTLTHPRPFSLAPVARAPSTVVTRDPPSSRASVIRSSVASASRRWEFCAPHYFDFQAPDASPGDEPVDAWFESAATKNLSTPVALRQKLRASNAVARVAAAEVGAERAARAPADDARTPLGDANARRRETNDPRSPSPGRAKRSAREGSETERDSARRRAEVKPAAAAPPTSAAKPSGEKQSKHRSGDASPRAAETTHATPEPSSVALVASPSVVPIAGLSPVVAAPEKVPARSSPRLRAAALAAGLAAASKEAPANEAPNEPGVDVVRSTPFRFPAVGASARRAPARGAATKTPSRLGEASEDSAAREARAVTPGFAAAPRARALVSTDHRLEERTETPRDGPERPERPERPGASDADAWTRDAPGLGVRLRPRRGGLTGGGARRVLVDISATAASPRLPDGAGARDTPPLASRALDVPEADGRLAGFRAALPMDDDSRAASAGKSSVKSSGGSPSPSPGPNGAAAREGGALSAAGRSSRSSRSSRARPAAGSRRAPRAPPPKDLTVPVSPAITRRARGSKRARSEEKTSEELDLARSLAAAAREKAKRRRVAAGAARTRTRTKARRSETGAAFGSRFGPSEEAKRETRSAAARATRPRSPNLSRARGERFARATAKTSEELELERLAAAPRFRARPLRRAVLQGSAGAAEKAAAAAAKQREAAAGAAQNKPAPFDAAVGRARTRDERAAERAELAARDAKRARAAAEAEPFGFAGAVPPTHPESPAFATARRAVLRAPHDSVGDAREGPAAATRGARRVAVSDVDAAGAAAGAATASFAGRVDGVTCPAPFALATDRRGAAARADLEFRLEQTARAEAARAEAAVKARPVPKTSSSRRRSRLPDPVFKPPTSTEPFALRGEALRAHERRRETERLEREKEKEEKRRRFVAAPPPETTFRPGFATRRSEKPLTTPAEGVLAAGERRAAERAAFDAEMAALAKQREEALAESKRLEAAKEAEARAALRESTRFAAAPIPDYDALASLGVAPVAERALTRPESPPLRTNRRASRWG